MRQTRMTALAAAALAASACSTTIQVPEKYQVEVPGCQIEVVDTRLNAGAIPFTTYAQEHSLKMTIPLRQVVRHTLCEDPGLSDRNLLVSVDEANCRGADGLKEALSWGTLLRGRFKVMIRDFDTDRSVVVSGTGPHEQAAPVRVQCRVALLDAMSKLNEAVNQALQPRPGSILHNVSSTQ